MSLAYNRSPRCQPIMSSLAISSPRSCLAMTYRAFDEMLAPGYVNHNPFAEPGPEGVKKVFGAIIAGVPDLKVFAEDVFGSADGTRVVGRYRYVGTHTGSFLGYPATGNAFAMRSIDIWRVEDGRFVEHWDELNTLDIFSQVGAV